MVGRGGGGASWIFWAFWCNLENGLILNYLGGQRFNIKLSLRKGLTLNHSAGPIWFNVKP